MPNADNDDWDFLDTADAHKRDRRAREEAFKRASVPRGAPNEALRDKYARQALSSETELLASTGEGRRNDQLNVAAFKLGQLVAAGALDESEVRRELESACKRNGYIQEHGLRSFTQSFNSGMRDGKLEPRDLTSVDWHIEKDYVATPVIKLKIEETEQGFWQARDSLRQIYIASLSSMCSPWAVLGCCAARALAIVPPHVRLPALIGGGGGSLNFFVSIVGRSGAGKGAAMKTAEYLVNRHVLQKNLGSGEGAIDAYYRPADKETGEPPGQYESVLFNVDEIDSMAALQSRQGATLLSTLRSGFSGATIGFSYRSNKAHLEGDSYRMCMIVGTQPNRSGFLLGDEAGGTPQRFMWFPATDERISADPPLMPGTLELPDDEWWAYGRERGIDLRVPQVVREYIINARVKDMRGQTDSMSGHKPFVQEKFAYALAVLDGRHEMSSEDWELAAVAMDVSDKTREWMAELQESAENEDARREGRRLGIKSLAAKDEESHQHSREVNRVAHWAKQKIEAAGADGIANRDLMNKANARDRATLKNALAALESNDVVMREGSSWRLMTADDEQF